MKIKLLTLMALTPFSINATEIICAGQGNQGELIEIELNYFEAKKEIQIDALFFFIKIIS